MADKIRVVDTELQACIAEYKASLATLNECVDIYNGALEALRSDWTGRAFAIMSVKVADMLEKIASSYERVEDAVDELEQTNTLFEENEQKLTSSFNNMDVGTKSPFVG